MPDPVTDWTRETTLSRPARDFWWRREPDGGLTILRRLKAGRGKHRDQTQTLGPDELDRLLAFMADGEWHRAAPSAPTRPGAEPDSIAVFLRRELGWRTYACVVAAHFAVVLTNAGLWEWNGRRKGMAFRQLDGDLATLDAYAARRRAEAAEPEPRPRPRGRARQAPPAIDLWAQWRALSKGLQARLDELEAGGRHAADKGARREAVVRDFLVAHLPDDYAAIEIKPRLRRAGVREAVETLHSVSRLPRDAVVGPPRERRPNPPVFTAVIACESVHRRFLAALSATTLRPPDLTRYLFRADLPPEEFL